MRDKRATDGVLAEAYRLVRSGGRIKYANHMWQHDLLKPHVGKVVMVCGDYWQQELDVFGDAVGFNGFTIKRNDGKV